MFWQTCQTSTLQNAEIQKGQRIVSEMEKIEEDFYTSYEAVRDYLDSRRDDASSVTSDTFSIDLLQRINITDDSSETYRKEAMLTARPCKSTEVTFSSHNRNISDSGPVKMTNKKLSQVILSNQNDFIDSQTYENRKLDTQSGNGSDFLQNNQCKAEHLSKSIPISLNHVTNEPSVNKYTAPNTTRTDAVTSKPVAASCDAPSIGQDLWRQLKRVQIPFFAGDKRMYQSWKAAFIACIDSAPATG